MAQPSYTVAPHTNHLVHRLSTVDDDGFAGQIRSEIGCQVDDGASYIARGTLAAEWDASAHGCAHFGRGVDVMKARVN